MQRILFGTVSAALMSVTLVASAESNGLPRLSSDLTIPELVAELEKRGYRRFESIESGQRAIIVELATPSGDKARLKYLAGTGRVVRADDGVETE